jgi:hypothetical protein
MNRQSSAYLAFWGEEFSLQEFSALAKLQATSSRIRGEEICAGIAAKECLWQYECSSADSCKGLDESLEKLRMAFLAQTGSIRQVMLAHRLEARCTVVLALRKGENPGLRLSPDFVCFLAEIGASFELDDYQ